MSKKTKHPFFLVNIIQPDVQTEIEIFKIVLKIYGRYFSKLLKPKVKVNKYLRKIPAPK